MAGPHDHPPQVLSAVRPRWPVVLFDLDGTLADTITLIVESYNHALSTVVGRTRDPAEIRSWIGRPLVETFEAVDPVLAPEMDRIYREWNLANTDRLVRPYAGIAELLASLTEAEVRTGVVTSKRRETALLALRAVGIAEAIPLLAGLEDTASHKPGPAPLLHAAAQLGVDPTDCVYIGDAAVDVVAARAAGMAAIAVTWGAASEESLVAAIPHALVTTVADLAALLLPDPT